MYNGVLNVYKEPGYTSFDVVAKLRGILKQKKIGHTGTLDPDAEGVLVCCLGNATRLCDILTDKDKCYEATMRLGITTDTEDMTGTVLNRQTVDVSKDQVREAVESFVGVYEQVPPMYSAIKVDGKKLYELARKGIEIERTPRTVQIHSITIQSIELPLVSFKVSCGKGTYIRSLCRDIGQKLGCGAAMEHLVRRSVNAQETGKEFLLADALKLDQIEAYEKEGILSDHILPVESMFPQLLHVHVTQDGEKKLLNGNILGIRDFEEKILPDAETDRILVYDRNGRFRAVYRYSIQVKAWKADKMFL